MRASNPEVLAPKSIACTTNAQGIVLHIFSGKPNSKCLLTVLNKVNHVNKIKARYKLLRLNMKLSETLLYAYVRPFRHCLYYICERKFYARRHGKIARQWKSTLTLITIVSALLL